MPAIAPSRRALVVTGADAAKIRRLPLSIELHDGQTAGPVVDPELVERARSEGFQAGYTDGHAAGLEAAERAAAAGESQRFARVQRAIDALQVATSDLDQREAVALTELEDVLTAAAFAIAESLLGAELSVGAEPRARAAVARSMALAPERGSLTVRLHPDDAAALLHHGAGSTVRIDGREIEIIADPALTAGDARADVGGTRIDARLLPAVERAAAAAGLLQ